MNMIFDTHAHYDDESFDEDRETLLSELPNKNIFSVVNAASNIESSKKSVLIAKKYSYIKYVFIIRMQIAKFVEICRTNKVEFVVQKELY